MGEKVVKRKEFLEKMKNELQNIQNFDTSDTKNVICEVLCLKPKDYLLKNEFSDEEMEKLGKVVQKLQKNEPLDKILGKKCFFGRDFLTNENVLSPRAETELLVEQGLNYLQKMTSKPLYVLDLCCGSGCIGLTIACETGGNVRVVLSDISKPALDVAKTNGTKLDAKNVKFILGDMFEGLKDDEKFDIIISNPPYIASSEIQNLSPQVKNFDPLLSLDGGKDGLKFYRQIATNAEKYLKKNGVILVEIGCKQGACVQEIFANFGYTTKLIKDYSQNDRIVVAERNL